MYLPDFYPKEKRGWLSSKTTYKVEPSHIAKLIQERGEESSFLGELALGILMFQDIIFQILQNGFGINQS